MIDKKVIYPKVVRPGITKSFPRKRLFRLLDARRGTGAVWVCAPPGAGKTTLVNSHLGSRKFHCLWYQVDRQDGDIAAFFHYLSLGALSVFKTRKALPVLKPENIPDWPPLPQTTLAYSLTAHRNPLP